MCLQIRSKIGNNLLGNMVMSEGADPPPLPGQHSIADPTDWGVGEPAPTCKYGGSGPGPHLPYGGTS